MALSPFDVSNLNESMRGLGNTFVVNRQQAEQKRANIAAELLRQKMLDVENQRAQSTEAYQKRMEGRADAATRVQADRYTAQDDRELLQEIFKANSEGQIQDIDAVNRALSNHPRLGATGIQLKAVAPRKGFETRAGREFELWKQEQAKADALVAEAANESEATRDERMQMLQQAKKIRADADAFFKNKAQDATETVTESEETNPNDPTQIIKKRAVTRKQAAGAGTTATTKFVRDPKTGMLVPEK